MTSVFMKPKKELPPPTAQEIRNAEMVLRKAKVQVTIAQPFFSSLLMRRKIVLDPKIATACVNAAGNIRIGTAFAANLPVQQMVWVLCHEVMHYALTHHIRRGWRKPRAWNIAGDKVINDILNKAGVGETWPHAIRHDGASGSTAEQLYEESGGGGEDGYDPGGGTDDLDDSGNFSEADIREIDETVRIEVAQAAQTAKQQGKLPAGMEKFIDEIINPKTPWYELLMPYMQRFIKTDYSWKRPAKKFIGMDLYMPSHDLLPQMGTVVIQSDESGSIGDKERAHFAGHINHILEVCRPERVIVLHTDTHVHNHVDEYTLDDFPIKFKTYCCGGTDMTAGLRWCDEHGVEPEVFITLTDGYTPFPDKEPPFPTVWLITSDVVAPNGLTIPYEIV